MSISVFQVHAKRWEQKGTRVVTGLGSIRAAWTQAPTQCWVEHRPFDLTGYDAYLRWYSLRTRIQYVQSADPTSFEPGQTSDTSFQVSSVVGLRHHAVSDLILVNLTYRKET